MACNWSYQMHGWTDGKPNQVPGFNKEGIPIYIDLDAVSACRQEIATAFALRLKQVLENQEHAIQRSRTLVHTPTTLRLGPLSRAALRIEQAARSLWRVIHARRA